MKKIIAKPVRMFKLFYDLVFVYAISKITARVHHPVNGGIPCLPVMWIFLKNHQSSSDKQRFYLDV